MTTKKLFFIFIAILFLAVLFTTMNDAIYYRITRKSGDVYKKNTLGRFEGEGKVYKNGVKIFEGNFRDGKEDGAFSSYFDDGQIKLKEFYNNGIKTGYEYRYWPNGNMSYKGLFKGGKWYGNQFYYSEKGILQEYWARDFKDNPNDFFYIFFNPKGDVKKIMGSVISAHFASWRNNTIEILNPDSSYSNIKDLYITAASYPPNFKTTVKIQINDKKYEIESLRSNTVLVKDAFNISGNYLIEAYGILKDKNKVLKRDTIRMVIRKI